MAEAPSMILALTSEADETKAEALALVLLERRLVACVTLTPMRSLYRWQGEVQQDREVQLLLKTSLDCLAELRQTVMDFHSYELPEWLVWPATASAAYESWSAANCLSET